MSVRAPHHAPGQGSLDVLTGGRDAPGWAEGWSSAARRRLLAGAVLTAALVGGAVLGARPAPPGPAPTADPVRFALHPRSALVPRHVPAEPGRAAVAGVHVELVHTGDTPLVLRSVSLVPGRWQVDIADRHQLRPGWSAVLALHRQVECAPDADPGPAPTELVVQAEVDGRLLVRTIDVGRDQQAYGGALDELLGSPQDVCRLDARSPLPGPIGDLFPVRDGWRPAG